MQIYANEICMQAKGTLVICTDNSRYYFQSERLSSLYSLPAEIWSFISIESKEMSFHHLFGEGDPIIYHIAEAVLVHRSDI